MRLSDMLIKKLSLSIILSAVCIGGTIGIALKFVTILGNYVYFPFFPNILDAFFLVLSVCFLGFRAITSSNQSK